MQTYFESLPLVIRRINQVKDFLDNKNLSVYYLLPIPVQTNQLISGTAEYLYHNFQITFDCPIWITPVEFLDNNLVLCLLNLLSLVLDMLMQNHNKISEHLGYFHCV